MRTFCPDASSVTFAHRGELMAMNEYRRHAAECLSMVDDITIGPKNRLVLIAMAQAWLKLAQRAEANPGVDIVHERGFTFDNEGNDDGGKSNAERSACDETTKEEILRSS